METKPVKNLKGANQGDDGFIEIASPASSSQTWLRRIAMTGVAYGNITSVDRPKIILGIETSCDETAAAIAKADNPLDGVILLSNAVASSASLQAKYGGVIPEQAAREQLRCIIPVVKESLQLAGCSWQEIDAIAVTQGPGLIGSLLVGVETAKALSLAWNKPLIPVNHLSGHFFANWIVQTSDNLKTNRLPKFPAIGLLVSGGHTDLLLFTSSTEYQYLGGTRDDAAGEAFDKTARLLGLPYPGGALLSKLADSGNPQAFKLPRPMITSQDFDFSFSGLKTAVVNTVSWLSNDKQRADLAASIEQAIIDVLVKKTVAAAHKYQTEQIMLAGGVAANLKLKRAMQANFHNVVLVPPPALCTDNAAMIAATAFFLNEPLDPKQLQANPSLNLTQESVT